MAELALAVIPLCLGAIKGINTVRKKLKLLRHHDSELLLQEVLGPKQAEALIENTDDPGWNSPDLDNGIRAYLGRKLDRFRETVDGIEGLVRSLSESLNANTAEMTEPKKKAPRVREALDIVINRSKYETFIDNFKEANQEMKRLREAALKFQQHETKSLSKGSKPLPRSYQQVAHHSKSFYEALRASWACSQSQHMGHDVLLLIDNRQDGSLRIVPWGLCTSGLSCGSDSGTTTPLIADVGDEEDPLLQEAQRAHGVRNLTMHSLGVALLQIDQCDPLQQLDDIAQIRRVADLLERRPRLGQRYHKITQQCLDCDFGFGKNLAEPGLQNAIYNDVKTRGVDAFERPYQSGQTPSKRTSQAAGSDVAFPIFGILFSLLRQELSERAVLLGRLVPYKAEVEVDVRGCDDHSIRGLSRRGR
ncbi:uncharacterized protein PG986_014823 [Apiospora aurea]|uniref:Uncharacterized protein n=1 Tax=Apiospora aurea TaxID=335848 RepID=A0ABR1PU37_9PEZI